MSHREAGFVSERQVLSRRGRAFHKEAEPLKARQGLSKRDWAELYFFVSRIVLPFLAKT